MVLLVVLYAVAGFWAVPHFLRSGLTDFVSTHYKRQLALGEIRFNPFTFKLDVSDFSLPDSDGQADARLRQAARRPGVEEPLQAGSELSGDRAGAAAGADGDPAGWDFESRRPRQGIRERARAAAAEDRGADAAVYRSVRGRCRWRDVRGHELTRRHFGRSSSPSPSSCATSVRARRRAQRYNEYSLTAASPQGERLDWNGTFLLEPLSSHGTFAVTDLQASTIWSYLQQPLPLEIPSGVIGVKGEYNFDVAGDAPSIKVDVHDTTVSDLKLRPRQGTTDYVVLGKLECAGDAG